MNDRLMNIYELWEFRRCVARGLAMKGMDYESVMAFMEQNNVFSNWTIWERNNRPVDEAELIDVISEGK